MSNRQKGILIIILFFAIILLPVCVALIREHNLRQAEMQKTHP